MNDNKMPEPVAWRCNWNRSGEIAWLEYHDETDPLPEKWDAPPNETLPLYSAETVQALQAECEEQARLNGMGAEREARLMARVSELQAERDALANTDAGAALALLSRMRWACGDNGKRMQDELEDYLRGLAKDAARLDSGCIAIQERNEFGEEYTCLRTGLDLRAVIDAAMKEQGR